MPKQIDISGEVSGKLTIINKNQGSPITWTAKCECGNIRNNIRPGQWRQGNYKSCGCYKVTRDIVIGENFSKWTVLSRIENGKYKCICECKNISIIAKSDLIHKRSKQCIDCGHKSNIKPNNEAAINKVYRQYINNSKAMKRDFDLTLDQCKILFASDCFYCGSKPRSVSSVVNGSYHYNGIDRIDNNIGYLINNVYPCCYLCNFAKRSMSIETFINWLDEITEYRSKNV